MSLSLKFVRGSNIVDTEFVGHKKLHAIENFSQALNEVTFHCKFNGLY